MFAKVEQGAREAVEMSKAEKYAYAHSLLHRAREILADVLDSMEAIREREKLDEMESRLAAVIGPLETYYKAAETLFRDYKIGDPLDVDWGDLDELVAASERLLREFKPGDPVEIT